MTRINSASPVEHLTDEHLLAEHREIKRLPSVLKKANTQTIKIPAKFCLGPGHVKFFLNKKKAISIPIHCYYTFYLLKKIMKSC